MSDKEEEERERKTVSRYCISFSKLTTFAYVVYPDWDRFRSISSNKQLYLFLKNTVVWIFSVYNLFVCVWRILCTYSICVYLCAHQIVFAHQPNNSLQTRFSLQAQLIQSTYSNKYQLTHLTHSKWAYWGRIYFSFIKSICCVHYFMDYAASESLFQYIVKFYLPLFWEYVLIPDG